MRTRVGYVVHGAGGLHPPTAHIRVTRPLNAAVVAGAATGLQLDPSEAVPDVDVVLVQRDAVPAAFTDAFVRSVRDCGARLVVDVDDDFFGLEARARLSQAEYDPSRIASVEAVVRCADMVLVSTRALRDVVVPIAEGEVRVVPNRLDPEFWTSPVEAAPAPADGVVRALFTGSTTHAEDLALLRPVFAGLPVRLEVVGVHDGVDGDWYDRLPIPDGWTHYPEFVRWMRSQAARWSVGVAPLADEPFNRSKSDIKALDDALLGLPVVASRVCAYRGLARHGVRLVAPSDVAGWRRAVMASIGPSGGRRAERFRRHVVGRRMLGDDVLWRRAVLG